MGVRARAVTAVAGVVLVGGCAGTADNASTTALSTTAGVSTTEIPLPTWTGAEISAANLIGGLLLLDQRGCLVFDQPDGTRSDILWPAGFSAVASDDGVRVLDAAGVVVARAGQAMESNGGPLAAGMGVSEQCVDVSGPVIAFGPGVSPTSDLVGLGIPLAETRWVLDGSAAWLEVSGGRLIATNGCQSMQADVAVDDGRLFVTSAQLSAGPMCQVTDERGVQALAALAARDAVLTWSISGEQLLLTSAAGIELRYIAG